MRYIVLDKEGQPTPDSPFPTQEAAKEAVGKREAHDARVDQETQHQIVRIK